MTLLNPYFGEFGGQYVPQILMPALKQLEEAFVSAQRDPAFQAEFIDLLKNYAGRPTALTLCKNLTAGSNTKLYLKREDLLHGGAHKTNQVLGQALLAKRMGKTEIIAETGAGQHGVAAESMSQQESQQLFSAIVRGELEPSQLAAALISMKVRGERPEEIAGAAKALLDDAQPFPRPDYPFADIVGTGGDGTNSINISTASAFVAAACGAKIAKHGNRSVSSRSGSSDLLAAFGIRLDLPAEEARKALDDLGVCFLFAPQYHTGFRHAMPVRQQLKTRTLFNVLGPLINPARPPLALIGVYSPELVLPIAETLRVLGYQRAAVVHGGGMDEVAIHAPTHVAELNNGEISSYQLTPQSFGLETYPLEALLGGTPEENRDILARLLQGKGEPAHAAAVAANVALLLKLFGHEDLRQNARQALDMINSGQAYERVIALAARG